MLKKILKKEKADIYYLIEKFEKVRFAIVHTSLSNIVLYIYKNCSRGINLRNILLRELNIVLFYEAIAILMYFYSYIYKTIFFAILVKMD